MKDRWSDPGLTRNRFRSTTHCPATSIVLPGIFESPDWRYQRPPGFVPSSCYSPASGPLRQRVFVRKRGLAAKSRETPSRFSAKKDQYQVERREMKRLSVAAWALSPSTTSGPESGDTVVKPNGRQLHPHHTFFFPLPPLPFAPTLNRSSSGTFRRLTVTEQPSWNGRDHGSGSCSSSGIQLLWPGVNE